MFSIKSALGQFIRINYRGNYNLNCYLRISEKWQEIIGESLSNICKPSFYKNNTLTIKVKDSVWANEIMMKQVHIFRNIKELLSIEVLKLHTQIGKIEKTEEDNSKLIIENFILNEKQNKWIENTIKNSDIEDDDSWFTSKISPLMFM